MATYIYPYHVREEAHGTPEWHELRRSHIGCSELAALFGVSPWMSRKQLYALKKGEYEVKDNEYMARGRALEPQALAQYNKENQLELKPMVLKSKHCKLIASMDGYDTYRQCGVEIKCMSKDKHLEFKNTEVIPEHYIWQLQGQLFVTGAIYIDFYSYYQDENGNVDAYAKRTVAEEKYQKVIRKEVERFWDAYNDRREITTYPTTQSKTLQKLLTEYKKATYQIRKLEAEQAKLREEIDKFPKPKQGSWIGVDYYYADRIGPVDYKAIPELQGVNLSAYRKATTKVLTIKVHD